MKIDKVSQQIVTIALYLDKQVPGSVSEVWIDDKIINQIKTNLPSAENITQLVEESRQTIQSLTDQRRKHYLLAMLSCLDSQISNIDQIVPYSNFSANTFSYQIHRVSQQELDMVEADIQSTENKLELKRYEIFEKYTVGKDDYQAHFQKYISKIKSQLPKFVTDFPDQGFLFEITNNKPWSAFNSHIAPYQSKLTLNDDISFTEMDLHKLASHEAYGGHHSELSHKDRLLEQGRGEHGLVITFSPQTFISEAIAEGMYLILGILDKDELPFLLNWQYTRLTFALQNLATFLFFDDNLTKEQIHKELMNYDVRADTRQYILNFSTDPLFGRYAPVYYSAFNFIESIYKHATQKDQLTRALFSLPCTPELVTQEFNS